MMNGNFSFIYYILLLPVAIIFQSPLVLYFFHHVHSISPRLVPFVFLFLDFVTAYILHSVAAVYMRYQVRLMTILVEWFV